MLDSHPSAFRIRRLKAALLSVSLTLAGILLIMLNAYRYSIERSIRLFSLENLDYITTWMLRLYS